MAHLFDVVLLKGVIILSKAEQRYYDEQIIRQWGDLTEKAFKRALAEERKKYGVGPYGDLAHYDSIFVHTRDSDGHKECFVCRERNLVQRERTLFNSPETKEVIYLCPKCSHLYDVDIAGRKYPPGLSDEAKKYFSFLAWQDLVIIKWAAANGRYDAQRVMEETAGVLKRLNDLPGKIRAEQEERKRNSKGERRKALAQKASEINGFKQALGSPISYFSKFYDWKKTAADWPAHYQSSHRSCPICGAVAKEEISYKFYSDGDREPMYSYQLEKGEGGACAQCIELFHQDLVDGKYPPGLNVGLRRYFNFSAWYDLRGLEKAVQNCKMSKEEAAKKMDEVVQDLNTCPQRMSKIMIAEVDEIFERCQARERRRKQERDAQDFKLY